MLQALNELVAPYFKMERDKMITFKECCPKSVFKKIRKEAKSHLSWIELIEGNKAPIEEGVGFHWRKGNQIQTTMPKYPGWKYIRSTRRIEVGKDWVFERLTEKEMKYFMEKRLQHEQ